MGSHGSEYSTTDLMEDPELNMELVYSVNDALRNSVIFFSELFISQMTKLQLF